MQPKPFLQFNEKLSKISDVKNGKARFIQVARRTRHATYFSITDVMKLCQNKYVQQCRISEKYDFIIIHN